LSRHATGAEMIVHSFDMQLGGSVSSFTYGYNTTDESM